MLTGSYRWNPDAKTEQWRLGNTEGRPTPERTYKGALATLNYSKSKRISAVDVEQHLRGMGVLCPCNDFLASNSEGMASQTLRITDAMTRRPLEIG